MGQLELQSRTEGAGAIVSVKGTVDGFSGPQLEQELARFISTGRTFIIVNVKAADFISSAGWAILVVASHRMKPKGGRLVLSNLSASVSQVYDALDFKKILDVFDTEGAALESMGRGTR